MPDNTTEPRSLDERLAQLTADARGARDRRCVRMFIRVSVDERTRVHAAAAAVGKSLSRMLRDAVDVYCLRARGIAVFDRRRRAEPVDADRRASLAPGRRGYDTNGGEPR